MSNVPPIWTVYDHPIDFPDYYVARMFLFDKYGHPFATEKIIVCEHLMPIREVLAEKGLIPLRRNEEDDAKIIETWI